MMKTAKKDSLNNWYSWMFSRMTVFFGLGVVAAGTYVADYLPSSKSQKIDPDFKSSIISHTTKARSPIHAEMELDGDAAESAGDEFTLVVYVTTEHDASNINARWIIPDGIELVQGDQKPALYEIAKEESKEIRATFKQVSEVNEQIHFKLSGNATGLRSSLTLQYNSFDQPRIDQEKKNLREVASEQMKKDMAVDALQKGKSHTHKHIAE